MLSKEVSSITSFSNLNDWYTVASSRFRFPEEPSGLYQAVNHIMNMKGKRIRPVLLIMGCEAFGGDVSNALSPAYGIEVFHNFTLVHDDIMDEAHLRRGEPTVHQAYGLNTALLAGDVMMMFAYRFISDVPQPFIKPLLDLFNRTATQVMEGQQMDMEFEKKLKVNEGEYLTMIAYKTSVLLAAALQMGAIIGGADESDQQNIYEFGLKLGLAFQIKDDYLDAYGDERTGKRKGGDILQNKKTFLVIAALQNANMDDIQRYQNCLHESDSDKKVNKMLQFFADRQVPALVEDRMNQLYLESLASLDKLSIDAIHKDSLRQMASMIYHREY
ncbi:MAG: polyprenyl synthetase family protein [Candidatus Competibacteraceae bacterium]|nr:polyprenyl synthetase family protein [Candidatus Competibacteraceae bacterium]